jgi:hypothetical protein
MMQFVPSEPLAKILAQNNNSLLQYLKQCHGGVDAELPVSVLDTYLRSVGKIHV